MNPANTADGRHRVVIDKVSPAVDDGHYAMRPCQMHDLLSGARHLWHGDRNFASLDPSRSPAHVFRMPPGAVSLRAARPVLITSRRPVPDAAPPCRCFRPRSGGHPPA